MKKVVEVAAVQRQNVRLQDSTRDRPCKVFRIQHGYWPRGDNLSRAALRLGC